MRGAGDIAEQVVSLEQRVAALEEERRALGETIEAQAEQLAQLERQVSALEEGKRQRDEADAVGDDDDQCRGWRPPPRDHGLPDAGVVTLEEQPDEEHAFGPAAPLVAEWRGLRTADGTTGSRVDRASAAVRRWELEVAMIGDFGLTLPPGTEPLDASRREDHLTLATGGAGGSPKGVVQGQAAALAEKSAHTGRVVEVAWQVGYCHKLRGSGMELSEGLLRGDVRGSGEGTAGSGCGSRAGVTARTVASVVRTA